jgi:hypothetical protein
MVSPSLRRAVRAATLAGAVALALPGAASAAEVCPGVNAPAVASATPNTALDAKFTEYGNSGDGWTGGDSTYSARLPDGRQLWMFSDTPMPPITPPTRPDSTQLVNQSFVVQRGDRMSTVHGGTDAAPDHLVTPATPGNWYWLGAGTTWGAKLEVPLIEFRKTGTGAWDLAWTANALATFDTRKLEKAPKVTPLPSSADIMWSAWVERDGLVTYIYGVEDRGADKYLHIARTLGPIRGGHWQYYKGGDPKRLSSWSFKESDSARVMNHVSNEHSVHKLRKGLYMLTTMDTEVAFSNEIVAYFSCSPAGPFTNRTTLYHAPETGLWGSYGDPDIYSYNAHAHPELSSSGKVLISYNVNTFDTSIGGDFYRDVSIYRPRFIDVQLTP